MRSDEKRRGEEERRRGMTAIKETHVERWEEGRDENQMSTCRREGGNKATEAATFCSVASSTTLLDVSLFSFSLLFSSLLLISLP